jgi:hypothetical protein
MLKLGTCRGVAPSSQVFVDQIHARWYVLSLIVRWKNNRQALLACHGVEEAQRQALSNAVTELLVDFGDEQNLIKQRYQEG